MALAGAAGAFAGCAAGAVAGLAPGVWAMTAIAGASGHQLNDRGYELQQRSDYAGALPYLEQAVQRLQGTGPADPYEGYANYNLGYTLYRLGRCSEAIPYLRRAEKLEPDRSEPRSVRRAAQHC